MTTYTRTPTRTVYLDGKRCYGVVSLRTTQTFGGGVSTGTVVLRDPPVRPTIKMQVRWTWGYDGDEKPGFTGEIAKPALPSRRSKAIPIAIRLKCAMPFSGRIVLAR
jgi:hypothetical protein